VPIPPELVTILREHIEEFGTAADGRLFRTVTGGMIYDHTASWAAARIPALTPDQVRLVNGGQAYDLRHAVAVSCIWLRPTGMLILHPVPASEQVRAHFRRLGGGRGIRTHEEAHAP
jgi:hypothetical protein